jgi:hypothetical protein
VCEVVDQNHVAELGVKWLVLISGYTSLGKVSEQALTSQERPCSMDNDKYLKQQKVRNSDRSVI